MPVTISGSGTVTGAQVGHNAVATITATDASWSVPTLADPVVKVTVIGGGGAGGGYAVYDGLAGNSSTFSCSAGTATASGGALAQEGGYTGTPSTPLSWTAGNGGKGGQASPTYYMGQQGYGGEVVVAYFDLTGVTTASVTIGAGGVPANAGGYGGTGGDGVVIVEYRAG